MTRIRKIFGGRKLWFVIGFLIAMIIFDPGSRGVIDQEWARFRAMPMMVQFEKEAQVKLVEVFSSPFVTYHMRFFEKLSENVQQAQEYARSG